MSDLAQNWIQWLAAVIVIPLISIICYQVFENKSSIAVIKSEQAMDRAILHEIYDDLKAMRPAITIMADRLEQWEPANVR